MTGARNPSYPALADRFGLDAVAAEKLATLAAHVESRDEAPTTVREPQAIYEDHLADSLVGLELDEVRGADVIADLGAGGGFPGLPLAIARPAARVFLVESNGRKCEFIADLAERLELRNVAVVYRRVEEWRDLLGQVDVVTARALAPLDVVAEYAAPLLRMGGSLVAWRGKPEPKVEAEAARAAGVLGLSAHPARQVFPYPAALHRYLYVMSKVRETPERFPRRVGMARKRPLGRSV